MEELNESLSLKLKSFIQQQSIPFTQDLAPAMTLDSSSRQGISTSSMQIQQLVHDGIPPYIAQELYQNELDEQISPNSDDLLYKVMDQEFAQILEHWSHQGIEKFEIDNLTMVCTPVLGSIVLSEELMESNGLYSRLTGFIYKYLKETRQLTPKQLAVFA